MPTSLPVLRMLRFLVLFLVLLLLLFGAELLVPVERAVIVPFTALVADVSVATMRLFDPAVVAQGKVIANASGSFAISIERGCNGVEAMIILIAAILGSECS